MRNIFEVAQEVQEFIIRKKYKFCFIGGLAIQRWGEPRGTNDVDLTVLTGFGGEEKYIDAFLAQYSGRLPDVREVAISARVILLKTNDNIGIDISLAGMPFEEEAVSRASNFEFLPGIYLKTCSAEDLVVYKTFAGRDKDWGDLSGIIYRKHDLDWHYIETQLLPLLDLKEEPESWSKLMKLKSRCIKS